MPLLAHPPPGFEILRQASAPVTAVDDAVRRLVDDMFETMDAAEGVGLAASRSEAASGWRLSTRRATGSR
jgi:peptide deformylase